MSTSSNIINAKNDILNILSRCNKHELNEVEKWLNSPNYKTDLQNKVKLNKAEKQLKIISSFLKKEVPISGQFSSELIKYPIAGDLADCNENNTIHLDEFLYDNDEVSELVEQGKLNKYYCLECGSRNIKELTLISHSMSKQAVIYIIKVLLPKNLEGQQILDVGSRLGAVLYAVYFLTNASRIIGVEMNSDCCEMQKEIIEKYSMDQKRINIIHSDILDCVDTVVSSNVVIINVLDFFLDSNKHKKIWYFFKNHLRKGTLLVLNRCIITTLTDLKIITDFEDWLQICKPFQIENEILVDMDYSSEFFLYVIK